MKKQPYDTTDGPKQDCRSLFVDTVLQKIQHPKAVMLLPSKEGHDAKMVRDLWPSTRIVGIEEDATIFDAVKANRVIDAPYLGSVNEYIAHTIAAPKKQPPFDAAFIDTTNMPLPIHVADVCDFVHHLAADVCVLALTYVVDLLTPINQSRVENFVRTHAWLDEHEEEDDDPSWNKTPNVARAICSAIEEGYTVSERMRTRRTKPVKRDLKRLDLLEAFTYRSGRRPMHFILMHIEKF